MAHDDQTRQELETRLNARLKDARSARDRFAGRYNAYYDLTAPTKKRINDDANEPRSADDQDDIFDATFEEISENFAADMLDEFTPSYRSWTKHEPVSAVTSQSAKKKIGEFINQRMDFLYDQIRQSSFEEAVQECYHDMGIGPAAIMIRYAQDGAIDCEYVPLAELLILPGPRGGVGTRGWERSPMERELHIIWPNVDWPAVLNKTADSIRKSQARIKITEVWERDYEAEIEAWDYYLMVKGKVEYSGYQSGSGSCPLIVGRIRVSTPSAYGLGPASKAVPAARTLNRIAYLELKRLGKVVDPPGAYEDPEGIYNPELGLEPGYQYEVGEGFKWHDMSPANDIREGFFKREELEHVIRRALFQDKPFQRGLTPPTATQWIDESTDREKRKALPRARIHREWVLPIIRRFEWILEMRGELEQLEIGGEVIKIEPVSPLSRASDTQAAQVANQLVSLLVANFGEAAIRSIDVPTTAQNIQEKLGDDLVKFVEGGTLEQLMAMFADGALEGKGNGSQAPAPNPQGATR